MLYSISYVHMYVVCWFIILIYVRNYVASSNTVNDGCVFQSDEDIQAAITAYNSSCGLKLNVLLLQMNLMQLQLVKMPYQAII